MCAKILFTLLFTTLFLSSLAQSSNRSIEAEFEKHTLAFEKNHAQERGINLQKLDSSVVTRVEDNTVYKRDFHSYDSQCRITLDKGFQFNFDETDFFQITENRISYTDDSKTEVSLFTFDSNEPLTNDIRVEVIYNDDGRVFQSKREEWDIALNDWVPSFMDEYDYSLVDTIIVYNYSQTSNSSALVLTGKTIVEKFQNQRIHTSYVVTNGMNIPWARFTHDYHPISNMLINSFAEMSDDGNVWYPFSEKTTVLNVNDFSAYRISKRQDANNPGSLVKRDSTSFEYNENWQVTLEEKYDYVTNTAEAKFKLEHDYDTDNNLIQSRNYMPDEMDEFIFESFVDYYFSPCGLALSNKIIEEFPAKLIYANPILSNGIVTLNSNDPSKTFDFTLSDLLGRKILQQELQADQSIDLSPAKLNPGFYVMRLSHGQEQKIWKMIIQ